MNALRVALRINSGKNIFYFGIAERLRTLRYPIFTGRGRDGKRHLQRRFLRKRGAAGLPPQAHYVRQIPSFVAARHLPPERGKSALKGTPLSYAEAFPAQLKPSPWGRWHRRRR